MSAVSCTKHPFLFLLGNDFCTSSELLKLVVKDTKGVGVVETR